MYETFAWVYDTFMDNVPYESWGNYLLELFARQGIKDGLVLDLGCGTGKMTRRFASAGYDMIGVDLSPEMLQIAREQGESSCPDILYLQQDMRSFELYGTVRGIFSCCDVLNYLLSEEDLLQVFRLVNNYLDPGGLFVFDMNTPYKYEHLLGDQTFAENREESAFIWENSWYPGEQINAYELTLFLREGQEGSGERFRRFTEEHYQRSYSPRQVAALLQEAGMELLFTREAYTDTALRPQSERMLFAAREQGKS